MKRHKIWRVNWGFRTLSAALSYGWTSIKLSMSWCESSESFSCRNGRHWSQITRRIRRSVACCNNKIIYPYRRIIALIWPFFFLAVNSHSGKKKVKVNSKWHEKKFVWYTLSEIIYISAKKKRYFFVFRIGNDVNFDIDINKLPILRRLLITITACAFLTITLECFTSNCYLSTFTVSRR